MGGQAGKHVLEPGVGLQPVLLGGGEQTHDRSGALPGGRRTGKKPILFSQCDRTDGVFDRVIMCAL